MSSYLNLEIVKIHNETENSVSLILKTHNGKPDSFLPGQFLTFLFNDSGKEVRRAYSISSSPIDLPLLRVTIKKVHDNSTSTFCIDNAKVGQIMRCLPPLGNFTVKPSKELIRDFIIFGAGSGITPLFSMIKSIIYSEPKSRVVLFYGNRSIDSIIFKNELEELSKNFPEQFTMNHILSRPGNNWKGMKGRITKELALELISSLNNFDKQKSKYYLCGPEGMMANVLQSLDKLKIDHHNIHRENFELKILSVDKITEQLEREVTIFIKGNRHIVNVKPGDSILQNALKLGLELPNSCQRGECGTCRAKLLSGKLLLVSQTALSEEKIKEGYCLTCVGYPASDNVVILYEDQFEIID